MNTRYFPHPRLMLLTAILSGGLAAFGQPGKTPLVLTSTNDSNGNAVIVFKLNTGNAPSLQLAQKLSTGGKGGASTNAGILQFNDGFGAVANYGSNSVTQLLRNGDSIAVGSTIPLVNDCSKPDSVALTRDHLFVVGSTCVESYTWPSARNDGPVVTLTDPSAAQIAVGQTWAAVTLSSGSVLQLPLSSDGDLSGTIRAIALPDNANMVPLGAAFWKNDLGFTPAHSPNSFVILNENGDLHPIAGPTPPFPVNAPCWVAKGPGNTWYTGNSPGQAISIFLSDGQGGVFYKSVALPGAPTDLTVSDDQKWLAVIYSTGSDAHVGVFSIDEYGDLTHVATSGAIGLASFNGVAFSQ